MGVVKRICDSVSLLEDGRIVESGALTDVVADLGGRLSASLVALPPSPSIVGRTVEVLEARRPGQSSVLAAAAENLGTELVLAAGVVEELGGLAFHRSRVIVPENLGADDIVAELRRRGAQAAATGSETGREAA